MVWQHKQSPTIWIDDFEEAILTNLHYGVGFRIDFLINNKALDFILDDSSANVTLSDHTKMVGSSPDVASVIRRRDRSIWIVNDLISIA